MIIPLEEEFPKFSPEVIGISQATFNPNRSDKNLLASLAPACEQIRKQIRILGRLGLSRGGIEVSQNIEVVRGEVIGICIDDIGGNIIDSRVEDIGGTVVRGVDQLKIVVDESSGARDRVFISYSHKDETWIERFQTMLMPLVWNDKVLIWDDTKIRPGTKWREEIKKALNSTKVALLLVSPYFLASEFIAKHELPPLLEESKNQSVTIIWALLSACFYDKTEIANYQAAHNVSRPLDTLTPGKRSQAIYNICKELDEALHH